MTARTNATYFIVIGESLDGYDNFRIMHVKAQNTFQRIIAVAVYKRTRQDIWLYTPYVVLATITTTMISQDGIL